MADWRDEPDRRRGVSLAGLADGESVRVLTAGEPFWEDHKIEQDDGTVDQARAIHVPVMVLDHPDHLTDMSDDQIDGEQEYAIINSSSSFYQALKEVFPEDTQVTGQTLVITANQPNDVYSRYFTVEAE